MSEAYSEELSERYNERIELTTKMLNECRDENARLFEWAAKARDERNALATEVASTKAMVERLAFGIDEIRWLAQIDTMPDNSEFASQAQWDAHRLGNIAHDAYALVTEYEKAKE